MTITLSEHQQRAADRLLEREDGFSLGGYAGTGKTTVLGHVAEQDRSVIFAAPTNKAADVLRKKLPKGADVRTFHKLTQVPDIDEETGELLGFLPGDPLRKGTHVIVDEASMVGRKSWQIAEQALDGATVNLVGDLFQLPPVNDEPVFEKPDMILDEVFRQADVSPVLELATRLREKRDFDEGWLRELDIDRVDAYALKRDVDALDAIWEGDAQHLCFMNTTRRNFLRALRKNMLGVATPDPVEGDALLFYAREYTDWAGEPPRWQNGTEMTVEAILDSYEGAHNVTLIDRDDALYDVTLHNVLLDSPTPGAEIGRFPEHLRAAFAVASYAYSMTVHKAQGSEWRKVYLQAGARPRGLDGLRWLYTGITRASEELVWVE